MSVQEVAATTSGVTLNQVMGVSSAWLNVMCTSVKGVSHSTIQAQCVAS